MIHPRVICRRFIATICRRIKQRFGFAQLHIEQQLEFLPKEMREKIRFVILVFFHVSCYSELFDTKFDKLGSMKDLRRFVKFRQLSEPFLYYLPENPIRKFTFS